MSNPNESLFEWRRLRRKITFWRGAAFAILALAIIGGGVSLAMKGQDKNTPHIAKIRVEGLITENEELIGRIKDAGNNDAVHAIILNIDSSGAQQWAAKQSLRPYEQPLNKNPLFRKSARWRLLRVI